MSAVAVAARHYTSGPQVIEAARQLLEEVPLPALCEALAASQADDAEAILQALEKLSQFEEVRLGFLEDSSIDFLCKGAAALSPRIRQLVAHMIDRLMQQGDEACADRIITTGLLDACEELLMDAETDTAEAAARAVLAASKFQKACTVILGSGGAGGLVERLQKRAPKLPDIERIRVYHLFVELGRVSEVMFEALQVRGIYKLVLAAFFTDDLLLKLIAVELMDALGSYPRGQLLLGQEGVPEKLVAELADGMCDSSVRLVVTRLLGLVLLHTPQAIDTVLADRQVPFSQTFAAFLNSKDPAERLCALTAWTNASSQPRGLAFFLQWTPIFQQIVASAASPQGEVCKCAMTCWATVLQDRPPPSPLVHSGDTQEAHASELWTAAEQQLLPHVLKNLSQKPFPDIRCCTWRLLAALVQSRSAAQKMLPAEEMRTLLLDFTSETNSEARIAKHEFVSALVRYHGNWLSAFLDEKVEDLLSEHAQQGPHWQPREAAAMVGDQNAT